MNNNNINNVQELKVETKDINLYNRARDSVHLPIVDGLPLYKRVNNVTDSNYKSLDYSHDNDAKSDKWKIEVEKTFNSPRNIRRIFLGQNKTIVHYYQPIHKVTSGGNKNTSCVQTTSFSTKITIEDFINSVKKEQNIKVKIKGDKTGISALNDWAIKNAEEIYVDWTGVATPKYAQIAAKIYELQGFNHNKLVQRVFYTELGINPGADKSGTPYWKKKFPRLKVVGFVHNLDEAYENSGFKPGMDSIEDMLKTWCDDSNVRQMAENGVCGIAIHRFRPETMTVPEKEFSCDSGLYAYDRDILEPYTLAIKKRIDRYTAGIQTGTLNNDKVEEVEEVTKKGEFEIAYDVIYDNSPDPAREIKNLNMILMTNDKEAFIREANAFTKEGKKKYFGEELTKHGSK